MKNRIQSFKSISALFLIVILFMLPACNGKQWANDAEKSLKKVLADDPYQEVELFYGTDRESTGNTNPGKSYNDNKGKLCWGACTVGVPVDENIGKVEGSNFSMTTYGTRESASYELLDIRQLPLRSFTTNLSQRLSGNPSKTALVFVHGYNVSFENAALMSARMSYQMKYQGAPLFFSWPAGAGKLDYMADEQAADFTQPQLQEFLKSVVLGSDADSIYLVGSSMGCLPLCKAFAALQKELGTQDMMKFKDLILIVPDINRNLFVENILPGLKTTGVDITVYTSKRDKKLMQSHRERNGVRLGDTVNSSDIKGVTFVDASAVDTSLTDSSDYVKKGSIYNDIKAVIDRPLYK